ncbi:hypothetical protein PS918_01336 [Pseudomonas fluorescens]|uniref:Uncharacterized protein n=1 Tax=Pseudomonas fluorescens TaxID=294 RepID=A0A5E7RM75_PSEFL|nr:hypothetical protein PS918_01336 [Pseudomonas fluorescens]
MDVNDNAGSLTPRGVRAFIASVLAPTGGKNMTSRPLGRDNAAPVQ